MLRITALLNWTAVDTSKRSLFINTISADMEIEGISDVTVQLEAKTALVQMRHAVSEDRLKTAVEDAGYQLISVQ